MTTKPKWEQQREESRQLARGVHPPRKPNLFITETRLRAAWDALAEMDPDASMTPEAAEEFIATFVDPRSALDMRDEFGDFVVEMLAIAAAKEAAAKELEEQADAIRLGIERMTVSAVRMMEKLNVDELRGVHRILKLKKSRGAVEVFNESAIPAAFWRTRDDEDLHDADLMFSSFTEVINAMQDGSRELDVEAYTAVANKMMKQIRERRRVVDKIAIQKAWKEAGSDVKHVPIDELPEEDRERARNAAAVMETATGQEFDAITLPVVPGAAKRIEVSLDVK